LLGLCGVLNLLSLGLRIRLLLWAACLFAILALVGTIIDIVLLVRVGGGGIFLWLMLALGMLFLIFMITRQSVLLRDPLSFNPPGAGGAEESGGGGGGGSLRAPLVAQPVGYMAYPVPSTSYGGGGGAPPGTVYVVASTSLPAAGVPQYGGQAVIVPPPSAPQYPGALPPDADTAKAPPAYEF
jgi:hypothetical protein